jgi:hypothetical protein
MPSYKPGAGNRTGQLNFDRGDEGKPGGDADQGIQAREWGFQCSVRGMGLDLAECWALTGLED